MSESPAQQIQDRWRIGNIEMQPSVVRYRGDPIAGLIGNVSIAQMVWLMLWGELPCAGQAAQRAQAGRPVHPRGGEGKESTFRVFACILGAKDNNEA